MTKVIMMIMSTQVMLLMINDDDDDDDDGNDDDFDDDGGDEDDDHDDDNNDDQEHHQDYHDSRAGVYDADGHVIPTIGMENNSYNATNSMLLFFFRLQSRVTCWNPGRSRGGGCWPVQGGHEPRGPWNSFHRRHSPSRQTRMHCAVWPVWMAAILHACSQPQHWLSEWLCEVQDDLRTQESWLPEPSECAWSECRL